MNLLPSKAEQEAAKATQYDDFGKLNLSNIRSGVESILKLIGRGGIFDEYTLHDMSHINEMLGLLDWIVPEETKAVMKPADWLLIVLACYFHDMGLLVTRNEFTNTTRALRSTPTGLVITFEPPFSALGLLS